MLKKLYVTTTDAFLRPECKTACMMVEKGEAKAGLIVTTEPRRLRIRPAQSD